MANYNQFDPRVDLLVVETRTVFDPEIEAEIEKLDSGLDARAGKEIDTRHALARIAHREPERATKIHYERTHTGFTREITITRADLERIYDDVHAFDAEVDRQAGQDIDTQAAMQQALK